MWAAGPADRVVCVVEERAQPPPRAQNAASGRCGPQPQRQAEHARVCLAFPGNQAQHLPVGFWQGGERLADRAAKHHPLTWIGSLPGRAERGQAPGQPALPPGRPPLVTNRVAGDGIQPGQQHPWGGPPVPMPPGSGERIAHHILRRLPASQPALGIPQDGRGVTVEGLAKGILGVLGTHTDSLSPHPA